MKSVELNSQSSLSRYNREVGVRLHNVGKRFNREWIFRHFTYEFVSGKSYAITGANGSGKSTLLQVISGSLTHNEGTVEIGNGQQAISKGQWATNNESTTNLKLQISNLKPQTSNHQLYTSLSIAAPYLELIEEMTATEMLEFHSKFKPLIDNNSIPEILQTVGLQQAAKKQIRYYSSGMKQRLKLAQAFFSNTPILLLDEPTTNLDDEGIALYHHLIATYTQNKLVIISSNDKQEYEFCEQVIAIGDYK